jgi:two-component system chemotaxis sensor kinase CheA
LGENTELDKKVVDMIGEPLLHLIRNSIDHGLETPEERMKTGKSDMGTVELNAYQGGNNIMVEIKDDGRGLNKGRILKKAIENGLISQSDSQNISDNDIYQFIFAAGFSTAAQVTDISGRGVGMNVVNKLIQDFKGKILINTQEGQGSSYSRARSCRAGSRRAKAETHIFLETQTKARNYARTRDCRRRCFRTRSSGHFSA